MCGILVSPNATQTMTSPFDIIPNSIIVDIMNLVFQYPKNVHEQKITDRRLAHNAYKDLVSFGATCKRMRLILYHTTTSATEIWNEFDPSIFGSEIWIGFGRRGSPCTIPRSVTSNLLRCGFVTAPTMNQLTPKTIATMNNLQQLGFQIPYVETLTASFGQSVCAIAQAIIENHNITKLVIDVHNCPAWELCIDGHANVVNAMAFLILHSGDIINTYVEMSRLYHTPPMCSNDHKYDFLSIITNQDGTNVIKQPRTASYILDFSISINCPSECVNQFAEVMQNPKYSSPWCLFVNAYEDAMFITTQLIQSYQSYVSRMMDVLATINTSTVTQFIWHGATFPTSVAANRDFGMIGKILGTHPNIVNMVFPQCMQFMASAIEYNSDNFSRIKQLTVTSFQLRHAHILQYFPNLQELVVDNAHVSDFQSVEYHNHCCAIIMARCPHLMSYTYIYDHRPDRIDVTMSNPASIPRPTTLPSYVTYVCSHYSIIRTIVDESNWDH